MHPNLSRALAEAREQDAHRFIDAQQLGGPREQRRSPLWRYFHHRDTTHEQSLRRTGGRA